MPEFVRDHPELPVFRARSADDTWFYTPGKMTHVPRHSNDIPRAVLDFARVAADGWQSMHSLPFEPKCLTLYLSNQCNIACSYCYSSFANNARVPASANAAIQADPLPAISNNAMRAAARLVATNCAADGDAFSLVVHGGGEPTTEFERLQFAVSVTKALAGSARLDWTGYVSTNGVMPKNVAAWLGAAFSEVGMSCDGPPDIQDLERRTLAGARTSKHLERSAAILSDSAARFSIRSTVVPATMLHQADMVVYAADRLGADSVHLEPAYGGKHDWRRSDAKPFAAAFLDAVAAGRRHGVSVHLSGVRLDELHGPHCNLSKKVLNITPDGRVSACFLTTDGRLDEFAPFVAGHYEAGSDAYRFDERRMASMLESAALIPDACNACVNIMHCARDCPDRCAVKGQPSAGGFRCELQRALSRHWLNELAELARNGDGP